MAYAPISDWATSSCSSDIDGADGENETGENQTSARHGARGEKRGRVGGREGGREWGGCGVTCSGPRLSISLTRMMAGILVIVNSS